MTSKRAELASAGVALHAWRVGGGPQPLPAIWGKHPAASIPVFVDDEYTARIDRVLSDVTEVIGFPPGGWLLAAFFNWATRIDGKCHGWEPAMTAGPKAAVDGAPLPFRPRGRPVPGILQPSLVIPRALSLTRCCATLGKTKPVSATVALCDLDVNQFRVGSLQHPQERALTQTTRTCRKFVVPHDLQGPQMAL